MTNRRDLDRNPLQECDFSRRPRSALIGLSRESPKKIPRKLWRTSVSGSSYAGQWSLRGAAAKRARPSYLTRLPQRVWLVGLGFAVRMALAVGGSARADDRLSKPNFGTAAGFKICEDQTYALCQRPAALSLTRSLIANVTSRWATASACPSNSMRARMSAPSMPRAPRTVTW